MEKINGTLMARENPETFYVPKQEEKEAVTIGNHVKIGMRNEDGGGERFWMLVTETAFPTFKGTTANNLIQFDIEFGTELEFNEEHILDILD